ncbi:lysozyme [Sphingomonas sp. NCPPB 2930]
MLGKATRTVIAALAFSAAGLVGLTVREGYSDKAYPDPVLGTKVPTIGFGDTVGVKMGDTTTPVKALQRTLGHVQQDEGVIKRCVGVDVPLYQGEYDAYVELAHNIGSTNFCTGGRMGGTSGIVRRLQARDYAGACESILDWKLSGGLDCSTPGNRVCGGLWTDRLRLHKKCMEAGK